jgi:hypothetical protein
LTAAVRWHNLLIRRRDFGAVAADLSLELVP